MAQQWDKPGDTGKKEDVGKPGDLGKQGGEIGKQGGTMPPKEKEKEGTGLPKDQPR